MQERQLNRRQYFNELATTCEKYYIPYISHTKPITSGMRILEVGCGDGGNLLPFSRMGCETIGVDISETRIQDACRFFKEEGAKGEFIVSDVFLLDDLKGSFDVILCHDVIEHIDDKQGFLGKLHTFLKDDGIVFMSFPAWQMPFGGHQQICKSKLLSHLPFFHLLPKGLYRRILVWGGESNGCIEELMNIKQTRCPIELFEKCLRATSLRILTRTRYFINPHYEIKFGLRPRKLTSLIGNIPYIRNFFTTSSFYILGLKHNSK